MNGVYAAVPAKSFDRAKSRLGALLHGAARARLAQAMLADVLQALVESEIFDGVCLVTGDPRAAAVGRAFGAEIVPDIVESGTRKAAEIAIAAISAKRAAGMVFVPSDLPQITPGDARRAVETIARERVLLVPATRDGGVNLLAASPPDAIAPCFGPSSLRKHLAASRRAGIEPFVLRDARLGLDIDTPADVEAFLGLRTRTRSHRVLAELAGAARARSTSSPATSPPATSSPVTAEAS